MKYIVYLLGGLLAYMLVENLTQTQTIISLIVIIFIQHSVNSSAWSSSRKNYKQLEQDLILTDDENKQLRHSFNKLCLENKKLKDDIKCYNNSKQ